MKSYLLGVTAILAACSGAPPEAASSDVSEALSQHPIAVMPSIGSTRAPRSRSPHPLAPVAAAAVATGNGIDYHGGPIMAGTVNLYYIWYGDWSGKSAPAILNDWGNSIGGAPIYRINTTYSDSSGESVSGATHLAGSTSVGYSHGSSLADGDIWSIVNDVLSAGQLPADSSGVYFVLTSSDVNETSGFCTSYCGWHTASSRNGTDIKYSFVGDAARCNGSCGSGPSPNGDVSADSMASIIFHELSESVSDPLVNAWFDSNGGENGDKCAWNFGATYNAGNGAKANVHLGNRDYLLQQMWLNANGGSCQLSWGGGGGGGEIHGQGSKCLDLPGFATADGTNVDYWTCNGGANQAWTWTPQGQIVGENGKCLDLPGFATANGTPIDYWTCNGGANQVWVSGPNGSIRGYGGKCLDLPGGATADGTQVEYWDCNGGSNQSWTSP